MGRRWRHGRVVRQGSAKPCTPVRFRVPPLGVAKYVRAISSGGERFLDAEEVSGSNPLSPTLIYPANTKKSPAPGSKIVCIVHQPSSNALKTTLSDATRASPEQSSEEGGVHHPETSSGRRYIQQRREFSEVAPALVTLHTGHADQLKAGPLRVPPSLKGR